MGAIIKEYDNVAYVNENTVYPQMSFGAIKKLIAIVLRMLLEKQDGIFSNL